MFGLCKGADKRKGAGFREQNKRSMPPEACTLTLFPSGLRVAENYLRTRLCQVLDLFQKMLGPGPREYWTWSMDT